MKQEAVVGLIESIAGGGVPPGGADALAVLVDRLCTTPVGVTSIRQPEEAVRRHIGDALAGLDSIDAAPPGDLADVGAGGGVPGLVLAVFRPQRHVHLIEATGRKAAFITATATAMGLDVTVHAVRSEELAAGAGRDAYACVCARALAPPPVALELCLPLCQPGGRVVIWTRELDLDPLDRVAALLGGTRIEAPAGLCVVEKTSATPAAYPRRPGVAAKRPLA